MHLRQRIIVEQGFHHQFIAHRLALGASEYQNKFIIFHGFAAVTHRATYEKRPQRYKQL